MPGTGKTRTTAFAVRCLLALNRSVLVTAYTHSAVDNLLLKLVESGVTDMVRVGNRSAVHPNLHRFLVSERENHGFVDADGDGGNSGGGSSSSSSNISRGGEDGDDAHFRTPANYDTVSVRGVAGSHTGNGIGFGGSRGGGGGGGGGGVDQARALSERLQRCRLVATTCLTAASSKLLRSHKRFDVCVVDEAGQVNQVS